MELQIDSQRLHRLIREAGLDPCRTIEREQGSAGLAAVASGS